MAQMSDNDKNSSRDFGDILRLTNYNLDSGLTFHMKPQLYNFISGSLEYTDKYIEVADGHHVIVNQKGQTKIKTNNDNGDTFITTLHNLLLAPDI